MKNTSSQWGLSQVLITFLSDIGSPNGTSTRQHINEIILQKIWKYRGIFCSSKKEAFLFENVELKSVNFPH